MELQSQKAHKSSTADGETVDIQYFSGTLFTQSARGFLQALHTKHFIACIDLFRTLFFHAFFGHCCTVFHGTVVQCTAGLEYQKLYFLT